MKENKDAVFEAFTAKAMKRMEEKKVQKREVLHIPSLDQNITIRGLDYSEVVECSKIEDDEDPNKSDKYAIYLAVVEPDLKQVAMTMKDQGAIKEYPEVVDIFEMTEITQIATEVMKLSGAIGGKKVTVVEELKN